VILLEALDGILQHRDDEEVLGALWGPLAQHRVVLHREHDVGFEQPSFAYQVVLAHGQVDAVPIPVFEEPQKKGRAAQAVPRAGREAPRRASVKGKHFQVLIPRTTLRTRTFS
jgi:hypothetical protein